MALKVWLKLNGNLKNSGLKKMSFTNVDTAHTGYDGSNGVYDGSYTNNSFVSGGIISNETISLGQKHSMFCWFIFKTLNNNSSLGAGLVTQHRYENNRGTGITIKYVTSTTGYLSVNTGNGSSRTYNTYCGTTLLQANTWYHGGFTYDGQYIRIYVNGVCEKVQEYPNMSVADDKIALFCWSLKNNSSVPHPNYKLNGNLDDVRIYDNCLTDYDVERIYNGDTKMLQVSLPLHKDCRNVGLNNVDAVSSNVTFVDDELFVKSCNFNGSNSQIDTGYLNGLNCNDKSVSVWVKPNGTNDSKMAFRTNGTSPGRFYFGVKNASWNLSFGSKAWGYTSNATFSNGQWQHIAVILKNNIGNVYFNGEFSYSITGSSFNFPSNLILSPSSYMFNGLMNDLRIYNLALTDEDVERIYQNEEIILLPAEYEKLEYIQSNGNQCLDTEIKPSLSVKIDCKFQAVSVGGALIYGTPSTNNNELTAWCTGSGYNWRFGTIAASPSVSYTPTNLNHVLHDKNGIIINNVQKSTYSGTFVFNKNKNIFIFGHPEESNYGKSSIKLYSFKIFVENLIVRNFMPAKRKSDNIIGLYDMVSRQFFTNSGTGSFTGA